MRSRWCGWRPIAASTVPKLRSGSVHTPARYSRTREPDRPWSAKMSASPRWARSDFAATISPVVSLSSRCTMPGRRMPPIPDNPSPQWCSSAFTSVPLLWPGPGCTTSPVGLSMTIRSSSSKTIVSGMSSGSGVASTGGGTSKSTRAPSFGLELGLDATVPSTRTKPSPISSCNRVRDRPSSSRAAWSASSLSSRCPASSDPTAKAEISGPSSASIAMGSVAGWSVTRRTPIEGSPARTRRASRSLWSMRACAAAATAGLALKATPSPASPSMSRSLAPSPDRQHGGARQAEAVPQRDQALALGFAPEDRFPPRCRRAGHPRSPGCSTGARRSRSGAATASVNSVKPPDTRAQ